MGVWPAVKIRRGFTSPFLRKAYEMEEINTFGDLSLRLTDARENERKLFLKWR